MRSFESVKKEILEEFSFDIERHGGVLITEVLRGQKVRTDIGEALFDNMGESEVKKILSLAVSKTPDALEQIRKLATDCLDDLAEIEAGDRIELCEFGPVFI